MKRYFFSLAFGIFLFLILGPERVFAKYVLPYPSAMPGNKMYKAGRLLDMVKGYWHWGNIAQVKYHLALSDKYLVEAKTLMEYEQYLLASDALKRSDVQFERIVVPLKKAIEEKKDVRPLQLTIQDAGFKHREVLANLLEVVPAQFTWSPEKASPTNLNLKDMIKTSEEVRREAVNRVIAP
jgi:hypothetical protein